MTSAAPAGVPVALVTGGTRGIGAALSRRLAKNGTQVVAVYRGDTVAADALAAELPEVTPRQADVGDPAACAALVAAVVEEYGRLDHLVNNAGLLLEARSTDTSPEDWERTLSVNLSAAFHLSRAAIPTMREASYGRIVNVSSVTAVMGSPSEAAYGAAKAGLHGLTRSLAREVARAGITVNTVVPGVFETDMTLSMPEKTQEAIRRMIPLGRRGDPAEMAAAIAFLLGEDGGYCTGSVLTVDGGLGMGG
jgi:NAD(P)-dependent dehydrogenase (short-subunit alcohol dehydrogenase family)